MSRRGQDGTEMYIANRLPISIRSSDYGFGPSHSIPNETLRLSDVKPAGRTQSSVHFSLGFHISMLVTENINTG